MARMKTNAKKYDNKGKQGYKALIELLKYNTINIEDSNLKLEFDNIIFREEDIDIMDARHWPSITLGY